MLEEEIIADIEEIIYHNQENGYTVFIAVSNGNETFTAVGYMPTANEGEHIKLGGSWITHPEYGEQFKFSYYETILPTEKEMIYRYLASGIIYGVREATAKKIVDEFGDDSLNIMLKSPLRLSEIKGISKSKAEKIGQSFLEIQSMQNIVIFLQQYNISANKAVKVYNIIGPDAVSKIKENPYILADEIEGISFKTSDMIAQGQGYPHNSPKRINSGLKYILKNSSYLEGNTYLPEDILSEQGEYILNVSKVEISNQLNELMLSNDIVSDTINSTRVFYLSSLYNAEKYIAQRMIDMIGYEPETIMNDEQILDFITNFESNKNIELASEQNVAITTAVKQGVVILTGGPGTGKTTTINAIIEILEYCQLKIALAAPTGRAAKRMSELSGHEAKTIHRLLGATGPTEEGRFSRDETNPLSADVVILDEVSMIDTLLMYHFLRALKPGTKLIMSGDSDQLPSVGAGNILKDLILCKKIPVIRLSHIFRQAEKSLIVVNAHKINTGEHPVFNDHGNDFFFLYRNTADDILSTIMDLYCDRIPKTYKFDPLSQIQILTPTRKGIAGVTNLNKVLQMRFNPPDITVKEYNYGDMIFRVGDKVMQTKNNYDMFYSRPNGEDGMGIYNGDMGIITDISNYDKLMTITFDDDRIVEYPFNNLDELTLAYAITVHKSQGSEFETVIMPMYSFPPMLMCRNLFYTAVTRAKKLVILVGKERCAYAMIENNKENERFTGLMSNILKNIKHKNNI